MHGIRAFCLANRRLAAFALALALCMKVLLPAGFMLSSSFDGSSDKVLTLTVCHSGSEAPAVANVTVPLDGKAQGKDLQGKADGHCPYSSLSMTALGGASAPLLAIALAVILALGLSPARHLPFGQIAHLRPPLRGPPLPV
jgi:hypothetical protein